MNRKVLVIAAVLLSLVILGVFLAKSVKPKGNGGVTGANQKSTEGRGSCLKEVATVTVAMGSDFYEPGNLTVKKCTRVIFKNDSNKAHWPASDIHPTHGIYPEFDPKEAVEAGSEWSFVFDRAGRWKYHDHLMPVVRGVIEVAE